jgi:hypothetical protein
VVTDSEDCASEWKLVIPSVFIITPDTRILENLIQFQNQNIKDQRHIVLVFDDCGSDVKFMNSRIVNVLFSNGRHYGVTLLFALQTFNQLHLRNRTNLDYICLLNTPNTTILKKLHTEFGGLFDKNVLKTKIIDAISIIPGDDGDQCSDTSNRRGMCIIDNTNCQNTQLYRLSHSEYQYIHPTILHTLPRNLYIEPFEGNVPLRRSRDHCIIHINGKKHKIFIQK